MKRIEENLNTKIIVQILVIVFIISLIGCASGGGSKEATVAPVLSAPNELQGKMNGLAAIPVAGKSTKFMFGGMFWNGNVDGKPFFGGTFETEEEDGKTLITLTQTHMYSTQQNPITKKDVGWVKTPGPAIYLVYNPGPPETLLPTTK